MKMSTNFMTPSYNAETIDAFTLALTSESSSLFEATSSWSDVSSTDNSLFIRKDSGYSGIIKTTSPSTNYFRNV